MKEKDLIPWSWSSKTDLSVSNISDKINSLPQYFHKDAYQGFEEFSKIFIGCETFLSGGEEKEIGKSVSKNKTLPY